MKSKPAIHFFCFSLLTVLMLMSGCSDPRIDASSDDSMTDSIAKVRESLPEDKRDDFDEAVQIIAYSQTDFLGLFAEGMAGGISTETAMKTEAKMKDVMKDVMNGKTGTEVIAEAERIRREKKLSIHRK